LVARALKSSFFAGALGLIGKQKDKNQRKMLETARFTLKMVCQSLVDDGSVTSAVDGKEM
jgi:hypothetical protein